MPIIVGLFIISIIIGLIGTYSAYIISMKKRSGEQKHNTNNNANNVNTTTVNAGMSDNSYYTVWYG